MAQQPVLTIQQVTEADRLKLIKFVSERPMIWDSNILNNKNQVQTDWQNIATWLSTPGRNFDVDLVKKTWKNLRNKYRDNMKNVHSTWKYLKPLSFLKNEFDAKQAAKFVVNVTDGSETKKIETNVNQQCDYFYGSVREKFAIDRFKPFNISTSKNKIIPNSKNHNMADFGIVNGEFLQITIGINSTGKARTRVFRENRTFDSFSDASKYVRDYTFYSYDVFSVYLIVKRVSPSQAAELKIDSDFFNLAIKCGTSQRKDIKKRFNEQGLTGDLHKQILIASCTTEEAQKLGFSSSETWAYALELAFGRLRDLFGKNWDAGTKSFTLNNLSVQEAGGCFTPEWCYKTLLKLIKRSVEEDIEEAKRAMFCSELRSLLVTSYQRFSELMHRFN